MVDKFSSKEELITYLESCELIGLDSEWSQQSRELVKSFKAKEIDVNRWWVLTGVDWHCPCCRRSKPEIVRMNRHGHLIGEIHEHHDHVIDAVRAEFTKASENLPKILADQSAKKFYKRIAFGFSAYDNTLVCSDCNAADAEAKKLLNFPFGSYFSFSPQEISEFILVFPNQPHEISIRHAEAAWLAAQPIFNKRIELIKHIAHLAATDAHWYQPSEKTAKQEERHGELMFKHYGLATVSPSGPEGLLYNTNKHQGSPDSWRRKTNFPDPVPTEGQVRHMVALEYSNFDEHPDNWQCPVCGRNKFDCIRKTNKGKWSFNVVQRKIYEDGKSRLDFEMCKDCSDVSTNIGMEIKKRSGRLKNRVLSNLISREYLQRIIQPQHHCKHNIQNKIADDIVGELVEIAVQGGFD